MCATTNPLAARNTAGRPIGVLDEAAKRTSVVKSVLEISLPLSFSLPLGVLHIVRIVLRSICCKGFFNRLSILVDTHKSRNFNGVKRATKLNYPPPHPPPFHMPYTLMWLNKFHATIVTATFYTLYFISCHAASVLLFIKPPARCLALALAQKKKLLQQRVVHPVLQTLFYFCYRYKSHAAAALLSN